MQGGPVEGLSVGSLCRCGSWRGQRERALAGIDAGLRERDDDPKERELTEGAAAHRRVEHGERTLAHAAREAPAP